MKKAKKIQKFLCGLLIMVMVTTCFQMQTVHAETHYTKAKLTKMINTTKKEVTTAKKKWESEKKKYQAQTKGTTAIYGNIISINPFIVKDSWTNSYYWVTDSKNLSCLINVATGSIKLTGAYKIYNGYTCAVGRAVKVTANTAKCERIYKEKVDKLNKLKKAIKNYAKFDTKSQTVYLGEKTKIYYEWRYSEEYNNKNNFKVSYDKKMVKLTYDDYYIYVTPLKEGKTKLTISNELVNKKSILTLNMVKKPIEENTEEDDDSDFTDDNGYGDDSSYDDDNSSVDDSDYSDDDNYFDDDYSDDEYYDDDTY